LLFYISMDPCGLMQINDDDDESQDGGPRCFEFTLGFSFKHAAC